MNEEEQEEYKMNINKENLILPKKFRLCIEGNIGAGKSTLCKSLSYLFKSDLKYHVMVIEEKIDNDLLYKFNQDKKTYAFEFQKSMMNARLNALKEAENQLCINSTVYEKLIIIIDTGPIREYAFTHANYTLGNIIDDDYIQHIKEFEDLLISKSNGQIPNSKGLLPEYIILLDLPSSFAYNNMIKRNRSNEKLLSLNYLEQVKKSHRAQLFNNKFLTDSTTRFFCFDSPTFVKSEAVFEALSSIK